MVVADEVHFIKNHTSKRCKAALPLLQQAKRAVLLSGTPALSRPAELITLLQAALPAAKVTAKAFAARYCQVRSVSVVWLLVCEYWLLTPSGPGGSLWAVRVCIPALHRSCWLLQLVSQP